MQTFRDAATLLILLLLVLTVRVRPAETAETAQRNEGLFGEVQAAGLPAIAENASGPLAIPAAPPMASCPAHIELDTEIHAGIGEASLEADRNNDVRDVRTLAIRVARNAC